MHVTQGIYTYIDSIKVTSSKDIFRGCLIYLHAGWSYHRQFKYLLLCPLSAECYEFPLLIDSTVALMPHSVSNKY